MVSGSLQALHQEVGKLSQELEHLKRSATVYLGLLHVLMKDRHVTDANITVASVNQVFAEEKLVIDWREEWQKWRLRRVPKIDGPRIHRPPPGFKA
jgi:hypothetical protein